MTSSREMVLIGGVAKALKSRGSWTGETHVQKTAFIAKIKRGIPFESEFVLYKHGPFSFDLSKSIVHMLARGLLTAEPNPGYGPTLLLNLPLWNALDAKLGHLFEEFAEGIDTISDRLAQKNVAELERVATAVLISSEHPDMPLDEQANLIVQLKPHISRELALSALNEANSIH